ncbi:ATP-binding protein [Breznakiellaceae bacterium SP9]
MEIQRYTDEELSAMLNDLEADCIERKESFSGDTPRRAREAVCAFSNDLPNHKKAGVLFIGAKDDGTPSGLRISDQLLLTISDMKTDGNILPLPALTVEKRTLNGTAMAVVTVLPSDMPPVKYDGRIWIRTGPRRALANEQEERILNEKRRYNIVPYDLRPYNTANINDLSRVFFEEEYLPKAFAREVLDANNRSFEERLASCKMIFSIDNTMPTLAGLLAIGRNPQEFIYGAYVQFLRIDGTELSMPIVDELMAAGRLTEMFAKLDAKLIAHNRRASDTSRGPNTVTEDYPLTAVYQILCNAVQHRNYDGTNAPVSIHWYNDRIEIASPGGPYGEVTIEKFGQAGYVDYRNPNLTVVMKNLNLIQRFGQGLNTARSAMYQNGNPLPEFVVDTKRVTCILRKREALYG